MYALFVTKGQLHYRTQSNTTNRFWTLQHFPHIGPKAREAFNISTITPFTHTRRHWGLNIQPLHNLLMWTLEHVESLIDHRPQHYEHTELLHFFEQTTSWASLQVNLKARGEFNINHTSLPTHCTTDVQIPDHQKPRKPPLGSTTSENLSI